MPDNLKSAVTKACRYDPKAKSRLQASVEDIDCSGGRGLDRSFVQSLHGCDWIREGPNMILSNRMKGDGLENREKLPTGRSFFFLFASNKSKRTNPLIFHCLL
ncbi:MAG: ATP-binding protein [Proteobacteria bacterium]|nr:ATP-binding protein [Pseudomonadota bacterium]